MMLHTHKLIYMPNNLLALDVVNEYSHTCYRNILIEVFVRSAEYVEHSDVT